MVSLLELLPLSNSDEEDVDVPKHVRGGDDGGEEGGDASRRTWQTRLRRGSLSTLEVIGRTQPRAASHVRSRHLDQSPVLFWNCTASQSCGFAVQLAMHSASVPLYVVGKMLLARVLLPFASRHAPSRAS